ncbi:protein of unknown function [Desulfatibacillum alkenivorans DSM 16219]|jgi:tetratricopeptide (TPR) repeat protein|uniref:MAP3K TRAFs-binding domain-containing protein n=1 Tax=Desulfatibacillum alkenivorans DSM 16219 TaxID=1121393 RepID=A0A1M6W4J4_9BACT|nr:TRAFs-binding domain-containing protein [Desulfatibacillum alkenivorans]SHK88671.1 protein of unknown function [Desulfatibacillum alkenivorans DSM 16219]
MKPYCFVLMPFGRKTDQSGFEVDFDKVYDEILRPAIDDAGLNPIRADEEIFGGIIHKPMFERLMLCEYAVADLTTANANVFYELGVRHGIRPHSTTLVFAQGLRLPFDVAPLRALPYELDSNGIPSKSKDDRASLAKRLEECRTPVDDSPVFQLVTGMPRPNIARLKTDTFRDVIEYSHEIKEKLRKARAQGAEAIKTIEQELASIADIDPAIIVDLYLSYRSVEDWEAMVDLAAKMPPMLTDSILVQEQLGFALNRMGKHSDAERILLNVIDKHGPSSETNGILGRVYKDLWKKHIKTDRSKIAIGYLKKAVDCYLKGFEADWRDAYPGINAVTLMELSNPVDPRQEKLLPVVRYAVERRLDSMRPDYWDFASLLEINVLVGDRGQADDALSKALTVIREIWEPKTTANNLELIRRAREQRGEESEWITEIVDELNKSAQG